MNVTILNPSVRCEFVSPTLLPLVRILKFAKKLARAGELTGSEATALFALEAELDSVTHFVKNERLPGIKYATPRELYGAYLLFCRTKGWTPHPRWRFESWLPGRSAS